MSPSPASLAPAPEPSAALVPGACPALDAGPGFVPSLAPNPESNPAPEGIALFATAIGHCALAWGPRGLRAVLLPEADGTEAGLRARMRRRFATLPLPASQAWPAEVVAAIGGIQALLEGQPRDLLELRLDDGHLPPFQRRVYAAARAIAPGQTCTYGDLAAQLGDVGLARAVGQALGANPFAPVVPCHRVRAARGGQGGFSAPGGVALKLRMLAIEGAVEPDGQQPLI